MGFEFRKQDSVEICGKRYALDISSPEFIGAVTEDFAAIYRSIMSSSSSRTTA